jgi:chaperonin GroEL
MQTQIIQQIKSAARVIGSTLGPNGKLVAITTENPNTHKSETILTKDGYKVSQSIKDTSPGANFVRQVCKRQVREVGDGTTSVAVLLAHLVDYSLKDLLALQAYEQPLKEYLEKVAVKTITHESLYNMAMVSSNGDTALSNVVADVVKRNGKDGYYIVEEREQDGITSEQIRGYVLDSGYTNQAFVNTKTGVEMTDPVVLVKEYMSLNDIAEPASRAIEQNKPFLCIGQCDEQALASLVANHMQGRGQFCNITLNAVGNKRADLIADLTILAPHIKKVHVGRKMSTFEYNDNADIKTLCKAIENESKSLAGAEKAWCKERLARLESKIAKIYVGAETTAQMVELKDRLEDAILAVIQGFDGYVPGAGRALSTFAPTKHKVWHVIRQAVGVDNVPNTVIEPANLVYQVFKTAVEQAILIKRTDYAI